MTKSAAAQLREDWKRMASTTPCEHMVLVLERSDNGYLTGNYVCTTCGEEVAQKKK